MNKQELKEKYGKKRVPHEWRGTDRFTALVTTFFGSGMSPKAPGTMGSLAAAVVAYPMALAASQSGVAFVPTGTIVAYPWILAIAFGLFRFFDILKPLGIHRFEKFPGAWGVMADDLLGGIYAGLLLIPVYYATTL